MTATQEGHRHGCCSSPHAGSPPPLPPQDLSLPPLPHARPPPAHPHRPRPHLPAGPPPRTERRRIPCPLRLLQDLPQPTRRHRAPGRGDQPRPPGRQRPPPGGRPEQEQATPAAGLARDFHLGLSAGFLYDCLDWKVRPLDLPGYRQWTLAQFSGTLGLDEIHLGRKTLPLATD